MLEVKVIGAGLAGCEAAWQLAERGIHVTLTEMKPQKMTPAHHCADFAELVCSNSLRGDRLENAVGLLKEELRRLLGFWFRIRFRLRFRFGFWFRRRLRGGFLHLRLRDSDLRLGRGVCLAARDRCVEIGLYELPVRVVGCAAQKCRAHKKRQHDAEHPAALCTPAVAQTVERGRIFRVKLRLHVIVHIGLLLFGIRDIPILPHLRPSEKRQS